MTNRHRLLLKTFTRKPRPNTIGQHFISGFLSENNLVAEVELKVARKWEMRNRNRSLSTFSVSRIWSFHVCVYNTNRLAALYFQVTLYKFMWNNSRLRSQWREYNAQTQHNACTTIITIIIKNNGQFVRRRIVLTHYEWSLKIRNKHGTK